MHEGRHLVQVAGELDFAGRDMVHGACVVDDSRDITVELHDLTFLDCSGYSGLVAARFELASRGGSLIVSRPKGQPARFLALVARLETSAATLAASRA
jgi:anti-anti-sigma factor